MAITKGLGERGYATFSFNFSDASGLDVMQHVADIAAVVDYFKTYDEIILVGGSFGAFSTAIAGRSEKITGLITLNGFFGFKDLAPRYRATFMTFKFLSVLSPRYRVIWHFFKQNFQPAHLLAPTLVIHAKADKTVYIAQSTQFFEALQGNKLFIRLEGADHNLTSDKVVASIVGVVDVWLQTI
ncbi:MAG TPA: prolyl oligopeptidase family serine peptidase [Patescibacteria group bacterium]|nr:prolyl oligopeptidase family serine peptidase [Patescibacteria group bacterium]